ncbi:MAG TPA: DUF885 domain-containing protein [Alphaproteobacteria bacterium]|nr:DUF885 domain-containing protein [Alphaproteobacteria bacterium]
MTGRYLAASLLASLTILLVVHLARAADSVTFSAMVEAWYRDNFQAHPLMADGAGFHEWDAKLEDVSLAAHQVERKRLHAWLDRFDKIDSSSLDLKDRDDREVIIGQINAALLEEERIQAWRHDPNRYSSLAVESLFQLVKRDFAPIADRMRDAIAREKQVPGMLTAAKEVIQDPPKVYIEIALENIEGGLDFLKSGPPDAFKSVQDRGLQNEFASVNAATITALQDYRDWLKGLLPNAHGSFALGAENYRLKLEYEEMIDVPLDRLLSIGYANLKKDQEALAVAARRVDPIKSTDDVIATIAKDHPTADGLVPTARDELVALRKFIVDENLTPLPPERAPAVGPTPEFERAIIQAEMDAPGPYEKHATEAFYFITPPAPSLTPKQKEEYLEGFNIPTLNNVSVHEVFPGHFVQLMLMRSMPGLSMVRRLTNTNSNVEGWAHYCEQMMLDEGFGGGDPKLRIGQLLDALLRDVRYVVGIEMHTRGMSVEQAADMFVREAHQPGPIALMEARRGTSDPTYLYYTVGKLEILKLREDWKAKMGSAYSIGDFHKRLIEGGTVPIRIIRREMTGSDGPLL